MNKPGPGGGGGGGASDSIVEDISSVADFISVGEAVY